MPLPVLVSSLASQTRPGFLSLPTIFTCLAVYAAHLIARGPRTSRDRDLHDRLFVVTGIFDSAIALAVVEELARRGARVIGIAHPKHFEGITVEGDKGKLPEGSSVVEILLESIRTRSKNKEVFLEPVDISSPHSIREFCGKLIKSENRLDGLVFCHEYRSVGSFLSRGHGSSQKRRRTEWEIQEETNRQIGSLATFYMTTLFLPSLLAAPTDRDIRIVNVVNPFYAAALSDASHAHFTQSLTSKGSGKRDLQPSVGKKASTLVKEGIRSLRMIVFMRHLQTVLNALPAAPVPNANQVPAQSLPFQNDKTMNKGSSSNISVSSVNPGISLSDTVHPLLGQSWIGMIL
jgi:NAD(P)-dependent dehydrogenase (short-subunit alcohol dehydrogenase family)